MSSKLDPVICSGDTGQRIPCFVRCQLIIAWLSYIKEVHGKQGCMFGVWPRHLARLRRRRRGAYAPTSNAASHDNHEKLTHGLPILPYMSMGLHLATLRAVGAPPKKEETVQNSKTLNPDQLE